MIRKEESKTTRHRDMIFPWDFGKNTEKMYVDGT